MSLPQSIPQATLHSHPKSVLVIPARRGSTRFPNKPMAMVEGRKLLYRTWQIAQAVKNVDQVWVATDDQEILEFAQSFGANAVMTSAQCENGTARTFDAVTRLGIQPDVVVNLQGDALLTPPWVIQAVVDEMLSRPELQMATPATCLTWEKFEEFQKSKQNGRVSGTLVVFDLSKKALYFSKGTLPTLRPSPPTQGAAQKQGPIPSSDSPYFRHIGLYAYRYSVLQKYCSLQPTPLEQIEKLEQLRALESGIPIQIVPVDYRGRTHWSIDNPEDVPVAEAIIRREGELVP